jgi:SMC interacting uncharacterized protein involved in chromosome segregation
MAVGGQKKDPRDWKDKGFVVTCQKRLMKFFSESGFPYALGPKTLTSPSNKEFFQMFQFLYQRFDPSYKFGAKPEDEILPLLTGLNYPFKITKVPHLFASSSESVWLWCWPNNRRLDGSSRTRLSLQERLTCGLRSWAHCCG